jgi:nucleotide-binding universal stress UspA family protein
MLHDPMPPKVIACIDDSRYAEAVCDYAAWSATRMGAPLCLLHVLDRPGSEGAPDLSGAIGLGAREDLLAELASLDEQRARLAMEEGKLLLHAARERVEGLGAAAVETRQRHGGVVEALRALEPETRMLVVGKRGADTASEHGHIGSHLERIIRTLHKPILIAQQTFAPPRAFMLAFDGSATTRKGVEMIARGPLLKGLPCHLVTVGAETAGAREQLQAARRQLEVAGFEVHASIVAGDPEPTLTAYQEQRGIELLVMGAYGHSRIRHLIVGSTTTAMISGSKASLMVLR